VTGLSDEQNPAAGAEADEQYEVEVRRTITTRVRVRAASPAAARRAVRREEFRLPDQGAWDVEGPQVMVVRDAQGDTVFSAPSFDAAVLMAEPFTLTDTDAVRRARDFLYVHCRVFGPSCAIAVIDERGEPGGHCWTLTPADLGRALLHAIPHITADGMDTLRAAAEDAPAVLEQDAAPSEEPSASEGPGVTVTWTTTETARHRHRFTEDDVPPGHTVDSFRDAVGAHEVDEDYFADFEESLGELVSFERGTPEVEDLEQNLAEWARDRRGTQG